MSLHWLSPTPVSVCDPPSTHYASQKSSQASEPVGGRKDKSSSYAAAASKGNGKGNGVSAKPRKSKESNVDRSPQLKPGQRVKFYDKHGQEHQGVVQWSGPAPPAKKFPGIVVGIKTVSGYCISKCVKVV